MSQSPSPFTYPQQPAQAWDQSASDPAWRETRTLNQAGIASIVLGLIGLVCGGCLMALALKGPVRAMANADANLSQLASQMGTTPHQLIQTMLLSAGALAAAAGIAMAVLGVFVRRGSRGAIISLLSLNGLVLALVLFQFLGLGQAGSGAALAGTLCTILVPAITMTWLEVWLAKAIGASRRREAIRQAYAQWYWAQVAAWQQAQTASLQSTSQPLPQPYPPQQ